MSTVLGIWAHPDDEVFVSGGFMADAARRGDRVVCIHMTRGEAGLSYRKRRPPETVASLRQRELEASLECLGVEEQRFFGYPDGGLPQIPSDKAIAHLLDVLAEVQPDEILTFGHDGFTGHPDHQALSSWATTAFQQWNDSEARLCHATVSPEWKDAFVPALNEFDAFWPGYPTICPYPDVTLHLDEEILDAKVEALRAHTSQMTQFFDAYGEAFMRSLASREHFRVSQVARRDQEVAGIPRLISNRSQVAAL